MPVWVCCSILVPGPDLSRNTRVSLSCGRLIGRRCTDGPTHFHASELVPAQERPAARARPRSAADARSAPRAARPAAPRRRPAHRPTWRSAAARPACAADVLHRAHKAAAMRAGRKMRRNRRYAAEIERAGCESRQQSCRRDGVRMLMAIRPTVSKPAHREPQSGFDRAEGNSKGSRDLRMRLFARRTTTRMTRI